MLNRPVFNGFSLGKRNDYVFLHPELLVAIFFLRRDSPGRGRRFVMAVIDQLTKNVQRRDGFMGQDGMLSSVDQLWATRLIEEFQRVRAQPGGLDRLTPRPDAYLVPQTRLIASVWVISLIVLAGVIAVLLNGWARGLGLIAIPIIFLIIGRVKTAK